MLGKDIKIDDPEEESHEKRAKKVIESIKKTIIERREKVKEAEDKLTEVLNKEIELITDKDDQAWDWD